MTAAMTSCRAAAFVFACSLIGCGRLGFDVVARDDGLVPSGGGERSDAGPSQGGAAGTAQDGVVGGAAGLGPSDGAVAQGGAPADAAMGGAGGVRTVALPASEDFEGSPATWSIWNNEGASATPSTQPARRGTGAIRFATTMPGRSAAYEWLIKPPKTSGLLYLRAFFFIPSGQTVADYVVLMEMTMPGSAEKFSFDLYNSNVFGSYLTTASPEADGPMITDRWFCAELELDIGAPRGSARFWIDGALQRERTNVRTLFMDGGHRGVDRVRVSAVAGPNQSSFVVFADDFVAAETRVGCNGQL